MKHIFPGKAGILQRVLPSYRAPFFNALGQVCEGGLGVFAGQPMPSEMIHPADPLEHAQIFRGKNLHLIFRNRLQFCYQFGLLNWLSTWNPDVLIVEANPRYLSTKSAIRWMQQKQRSVIGWGLGAQALKGIFTPLRQLRRQKFVHQFDAIITYSQAGAVEYAALGFPQERIFVAANAVTPPPGHPLPERSLHAGSTGRRILFVGRIQARKKLDNLLYACTRLPESLQPEIVIVGDGPDRQRIEALAEQNYPQAVFAGACYGETLVQHYLAADLFVLPGTGGLAIQEAMSYGLPIIVAEADGTQADLVRPENGWQVPPDDIPALTAALKDALENQVRLREMGAESYRIVAEEINLERMVTVFIEALTRSRQ